MLGRGENAGGRWNQQKNKDKNVEVMSMMLSREKISADRRLLSTNEKNLIFKKVVRKELSGFNTVTQWFIARPPGNFSPSCSPFLIVGWYPRPNLSDGTGRVPRAGELHSGGLLHVSDWPDPGLGWKVLHCPGLRQRRPPHLQVRTGQELSKVCFLR